MKKKFSIIFFLSITFLASAQHKYVAPSDPLVLKKLDEWKDLKFGLFMHWGTYSQWGIVESWSICPEDEGWTQRKGPHSGNYFEYVKAYENLQTSFNPVKFDPQKWVDAAKNAGMKYMIFTTKHHDGFSMFDTKQTDYKITDPKTPFSKNPKSNIAKEIFDAFRKQNFLTGAYFSKPDWHNQNYWWPYFPPKDRNVNYDPKKYPERWNAFKDFTFNQLKELMSEYGKMDIMWLDGGWVRPLSSVDTSVVWQKGIKDDQDIDMKKIATMARGYQPGIMIVDRTVTGEYENYTTPEQEVPDKPLPYPWETCMTMGNSWSYVPNDHYKTAHQLIQLLIKIVSRGGNFLLNIGPGPDGDWDPVAYSRLQEIGEWIKINGEGIYSSKPVSPYSTENIFFTQSKDGSAKYAFYLANDSTKLPEQIVIPGFPLQKSGSVSLLGSTKKLKWKTENGGLVINLAGVAVNSKHALCFRIKE
jgi:alpha-L-fucosidase